jgi:hypothetical protein
MAVRLDVLVALSAASSAAGPAGAGRTIAAVMRPETQKTPGEPGVFWCCDPSGI